MTIQLSPLSNFLLEDMLNCNWMVVSVSNAAVYSAKAPAAQHFSDSVVSEWVFAFCHNDIQWWKNRGPSFNIVTGNFSNLVCIFLRRYYRTILLFNHFNPQNDNPKHIRGLESHNSPIFISRLKKLTISPDVAINSNTSADSSIARESCFGLPVSNDGDAMLTHHCINNQADIPQCANELFSCIQ